LAKQNENSYIEIPKDISPRYSGLYTYRALLDILNKLKIIKSDDSSKSLKSTVTFLNNSIKLWLPEKATSINAAKQMALELMGRSVIIYSGPELFPAAYKWKLGINQNAKQLAWANQLPEYNHNELTGWSKQPTEKPFVVVELRSSFDHPRIIKRFEIGSKLTSGLRPEAVVVQAMGENAFQQLIYCMVFGEFVSIYLALLNGVDPTQLKLVEKFKLAMGQAET
jgi:glucose/mannose-6-phosphate isomerase